jgi:hypothetical protein
MEMGFWNVWTLAQLFSAVQLEKGITRYMLDLDGLYEVRWMGIEWNCLAVGEVSYKVAMSHKMRLDSA